MFHIRPAQPVDNHSLLELCRIPVSGAIQLALEREPDYFVGAGIQAEAPEVYVCMHGSGRLAGMFNVGYRCVFLEGVPTRVRYFCDLRIHPDFQRSRLLYEMLVYCRKNGIINDHEVAQTVIFSDNQPMLSHLDLSRRRHTRSLAPFYQYVGEYHTYMIRLSKRKLPCTISKLVIRRATPDDLPFMQSFLDKEGKRYQGFPCYLFHEIDKKKYFHNLTLSDYYLAMEADELVGMAGIWHQTSFKQTRVTGYSPFLKVLRPIVNLVALITGGFTLPPISSRLSYFSIHSLLIYDENPEIFKSLLLKISQDQSYKNYDYFLCSLRGDSSLSKAFRVFRQTRLIKGNYYLVSGNPDLPAKYLSKPFYLEGARI